MWIWQKNLKEGLEKWKFWNLWTLLTFFVFSNPRSGTSHDSHFPWYPWPCLLPWDSKLEQGPGPPLLTRRLLPGCAWSLSSTWRHPGGLPPGQLLLLWGPSAPRASHHHNAHSLYYNDLFMCLYPTLPDWELRQTGEHVLFMAESAGLRHSHHTVNLLNKWTSNWIRVPLTTVASNRGNQRSNNTHWLHWFLLKLLHYRLKTGPRLLQLFRTVFTLPCSHGFICAFSKAKCSSWAGHLVTGLSAEQSRWHQASHPLCPVGEGLLCLIGDLQPYSQSDTFQMQTAYCNLERYSLWQPV